jgi:hypothetical protein
MNVYECNVWCNVTCKWMSKHIWSHNHNLHSLRNDWSLFAAYFSALPLIFRCKFCIPLGTSFELLRPSISAVFTLTFRASPYISCDTPGVYFALCREINPNLGCSVKISISRSCLSLFIRLSLGSSPNSELIDREKHPILERVKTFILGTNANSIVNLEL